MILNRLLIRSSATAVVSLTIAGNCAWAANDPRGLDPSDAEFDRPISIMRSVTQIPPLTSITDTAPNNRAESGNPLWGITIESLRATRERPIFSPSRRPPTTAVLAAPAPLPPAPPPPDKPTLDLLGTVAGSGVGYAVFLDNTTHDIVRLKTGEGEGGWILRSVENREAVLVKNERTVVMRLPSPTGEQK